MVNKLKLLMSSFFRKSINQLITIFVLFVFSACLFNSFLNLAVDYSSNFDRACEKLNTDDIGFSYYNLFNIDRKEKVKEALDNLDYVESYEVDTCICGNGLADFNEGQITNLMTVISYTTAINKNINKFEILGYDNGKQGVILSYLFKASAKYNIGDTINIRLNNKNYSYEIIGFYNNCTTGTINCLDITFILSDSLFEDMLSNNTEGLRINIKVADGVNLEEAARNIEESISSKVNTLMLLSTENIDNVGEARYSNAVLFQSILSLGAIIMTIVLLIVVVISLRNYVSNNVKQLGTLKAMGYTSNDLIWPILATILLMSLLASFIGVGLSYLIFPLINSALESQIGIPYDIKFLLMPFIITLLIIIFVSIFTAYFSIIKIKKIAPINAIRENKDSKNKSSKIIKLEKTKTSVNTAIGLKGFFSSFTRNIIILFAITCVSFLSGFGVWLYQNVAKDNTGIIELVCGQTADSTLTVDYIYEEQLKTKLDNNESVDNYYLYCICNETPESLSNINIFVIEDSKYITNDNLIIEGCLPYDSNTIVLNKAYANKHNLDIGDTITFNNVDLLICGVSQGAYFAGRDCYILRSAYEKIDNLTFISYYVNLKEGVDIDEFNESISQEMPVRNYINQIKYLQSTADLYCNILNILVVVMCLLSVLIAVFVLYILLGILLKNKRKEHGILKSIGFTSNDIIKQTLITITPSCFIAIIIGLLLSRNLVQLILSSIGSPIGLIRIGNPTESIYLVLVGLFLSVFVVLYTYLLSRSVKKIAPHDLFNRE